METSLPFFIPPRWSHGRLEQRAIALVRRFQAAVRAAVPQQAGRVVKFIGDAALVESPSVESAVQSAAAGHSTLRERMRSSVASTKRSSGWIVSSWRAGPGPRIAWRSYRAGTGKATGLSFPSAEMDATPKK